MKSTTCLVAAVALFPLLAANAAIPIAHCRAGDKTESGLQGLTTPAEIAAGKAQQGFNCNTDIVGQYQGEGASWQLTAWKNCAYFDQALNANEKNPGTVVVDVSDPKNPKATQWLNDNAMLDPWESLKVNPKRQLLAAGQRPTAALNFAGTGFSIYDISTDCAHPVKKSFIDIPGSLGHTGQWAPDGNTYYITPLQNSISIEAIDTTDPSNPKLIPCGAGTVGCGSNGFFTAPPDFAALPRWHDTEYSKDGNTAYVTLFGSGATAASNGLLILDVSDFQGRKPNPAYRRIGQITWDDGSVGAQNALPVTIAGKPYILFSDEAGGAASGCASGKSAAGFPRLIDVSDPKNPKTAAKLILDIADPANCNTAATTPVTSATSNGGFGFSCHYCNVDDADNAKIAACNCFASGLRFFDISDVNYVKEIAYLKPKAVAANMAGSQLSARMAAGFPKNFDWATSKPSFPKDRGDTSGDVWTTTQDNGFLVVHLDSNATSGGGGGCASGDASIAGLIAFGAMELLRRRKLRKA